MGSQNDGTDETYSHINFSVDNRIAAIELNRPEKRNALSRDLMIELLRCLDAVARSRDISVVILKAAGKVFSSGHDLSEMLGKKADFYQNLFDICTRLMERVQSIPQPVIAQVQGVATAAGCQLAASCDLCIASEDARFATPGVKIGLFCTTPMVALTRAIPAKKAMEMLLTGEFIDAQEALHFGLVNRVVPQERLADETMRLAEKLLEASPGIVAIGKETFYRQLQLSQPQAYAYAKEVMALNATLPDAKEGIAAFLEKRSPSWRKNLD
jgi:enoyl-CoA hydratase/carnithine racemase